MAGKSSQFDPYHKWLGISPKDQPPHHYRLLGLELFEADTDVIDAAANRQMVYLQSCAAGEHGEAATALLTEIAAARLCLLNESTKATYDASLRADARARTTSATAPKRPMRAMHLAIGAGIGVLVIAVGIFVWHGSHARPAANVMRTAEATANTLPESGNATNPLAPPRQVLSSPPPDTSPQFKNIFDMNDPAASGSTATRRGSAEAPPTQPTVVAIAPVIEPTTVLPPTALIVPQTTASRASGPAAAPNPPVVAPLPVGPAKARPRLPAGLVLYYSFEADTLMKEGPDPKVNDLSPMENHGVMRHITSIAEGRIGNCATLHGDSLINAGQGGSLTFHNEFTVMTFVRVDHNMNSPLISKDDWARGGARGFTLRLTGGKPDMTVGAAGWHAALAPGQLKWNVWYHLAGSYDGKAIRLYVNGYKVSTKPVSGAFEASEQPLLIGCDPFERSRRFKGDLDEVMVFDRALTDMEIGRLSERR